MPDPTPSFEWNEDKNRSNFRKHGITFESSQLAFLDSKRVIAEDLAHSGSEKRYYCIGRVGEGVLTVRFTLRQDKIRIIGAGYWRKGRDTYEKANQIHE